jgi:hypothetical protein
MKRNIQQYWQEIRELEAGLPEFVWVISRGVVTQVPANAAARLLHAKTHRVATDAELHGHLRREEECSRRARREGLRREGKAIVVADERGDRRP